MGWQEHKKRRLQTVILSCCLHTTEHEMIFFPVGNEDRERRLYRLIKAFFSRMFSFVKKKLHGFTYQSMDYKNCLCLLRC